MAYRKTAQEVHDPERSALRRYQDVVVGSRSLWYTLKFEILTSLLGSFPGAVGLALRQKLYPKLFRSIGKGVVFGRNVTLLHPNRICIGDRVVIADGATLGARGSASEGVTIGNDTVLGPDVSISTKHGHIVIGNAVNMSRGATINAVEGTRIEIGDYALIAAGTYIGGGRYRTDRTDIPIALQGMDPQGGIQIGDHAWLGAHSVVLDGTSVGNDAIVGAGAVVTREIPPFAVALGVPAKVARIRESSEERLTSTGDLTPVTASAPA